MKTYFTILIIIAYIIGVQVGKRSNSVQQQLSGSAETASPKSPKGDF